MNKEKQECGWGRLSRILPGRHGTAYTAVQLRTAKEVVVPIMCSHLPCCCFPVCFQKQLYLATQYGPLWLLLPQNTVPTCQFAWREMQFRARLWLKS